MKNDEILFEKPNALFFSSVLTDMLTSSQHLRPVTHTFFTSSMDHHFKGMSLESKVFIWYMTLEHSYTHCYPLSLTHTHKFYFLPIQHAVVGYLPRTAQAGFDLLFLPGFWAGVMVAGELQGALFVSPSAKRLIRFRFYHRLWKTSIQFCSNVFT